MLDIEIVEFYTQICINCDLRPIRENGIAHCQVCADQKEAIRMNNKKNELTDNDRLIMSMKDYGEWNETEIVDEDIPDIADYIEHNAMAEEFITLNCHCGGVVLKKDIGGFDKLEENGIVFEGKSIVHKTIAGCYGEKE